MKTIKDIENLAGKKVLLRADYNVSIDNGEVQDDRKLKASLPTLAYLLDRKARIILMTHLDRPGGEVVETQRVDPIAEKLSDFLGQSVKKLDEYSGEKVESEIDNMDEGGIVMLENIRFSPDERENSGKLAQSLADLADIFVFDGFGVAHRDHSSVSGVAESLDSYAGLLVKKEVKNLDKVLSEPSRPLSLVMGGVKVETKLPVIEKLQDKTDYMMAGGGILNTFLASENIDIGDSVYNKDLLEHANELYQLEEIIKPLDVTVASTQYKNRRVEYIRDDTAKLCSKGEQILDLGPETIGRYQDYIEQSKTVIYNGAMGLFEQSPFHLGTQAILESIAKVAGRDDTFTVLGGGETVQSLSLIDDSSDIDFISSGGGAMLHYLSGKELPGLKHLSD
ncbi:MAG: phosphoglycerate kinase [Candidatus Magasanikbacteria bacterium]